MGPWLLKKHKTTKQKIPSLSIRPSWGARGEEIFRWGRGEGEKRKEGLQLSPFFASIFPLSPRNSLHDRRFMSQAGQTRYFARSTTRARSARRGKEKNKAPVRSPLFLLFRPLTPTNINYPRWCQKNQSKHDPLSRENCHLSGAKRLHCSRNEELRLFPWLRELLPKFTGLNHLILYVGQC